jgi:hypothetical protein
MVEEDFVDEENVASVDGGLTSLPLLFQFSNVLPFRRLTHEQEVVYY